MRYKKNLRVEGNKVYSYQTHVATIKGRQLVRHGYWSVTTSKHINHVAALFGLEVVDGPIGPANPEAEGAPSPFKVVSQAIAVGTVLCSTREERAAWNKRMLSTINGISFPDDFDSLPLEERERRLDGAIQVMREKGGE